LLLSHKREIDIMTAWIEQLQAQVGAVGHSPRPEQFGAAEPAVPTSLFVGDDEQDLMDALDQGIIDQPAFEEGLRKLGYLNTEVVVTR
jgi:hypothetical protein